MMRALAQHPRVQTLVLCQVQLPCHSLLHLLRSTLPRLDRPFTILILLHLNHFPLSTLERLPLCQMLLQLLLSCCHRTKRGR